MVYPSGLCRAVTRTLRGFTWYRFGVFCAAITFIAAAHGVLLYLAGKPPAAALAMFKDQYVYLFLLFGPIAAAVVAIGNWAPSRTGPRIATLVAAVVVGLVARELLCMVWLWVWPSEMKTPALLWQVTAVVLYSHVIAAGVLGYFFLAREEEAMARLHEHDMRREALDREFAETRLLVMQAQIEPHFLFNTLANVRRLFQTDPPAALAMLAHLSRYLSAMLPRMRRSDSTLGQELALAHAYLSVQQIRMGSRLTVRTDVPGALEDHAFPPMMLVTLVENAIRHGLTPLPEGGEVRVSARRVDGRLRVAVADTGAGLAESSGSGVGLANIRARLSTLYDGNARLLLAANAPHGVVATIEVPAIAARRDARAA